MLDAKKHTLEILDSLIERLNLRMKHKAPNQPEGAPPIPDTGKVLAAVKKARDEVATVK